MNSYQLLESILCETRTTFEAFARDWGADDFWYDSAKDTVVIYFRKGNEPEGAYSKLLRMGRHFYSLRHKTTKSGPDAGVTYKVRLSKPEF